MAIQAILIFVSLLSLAMGFSIWSGSAAQRSVRGLFLAITVSLAVWSFALGRFLVASTVQEIDIFSRMFYVSAAVFCPLLVAFIYCFLKHNGVKWPKTSHRWILVAIFLSIVYSIYIVTTSEFIVNLSAYGMDDPIDVSAIAIKSTQYQIFAIFFIIFYIFAVILGYYGWRALRGKRRKQLAAYLIGIVVASVPGYIVDLLLPSMGNYGLVWVGPVAILFFIAAIAYSIVMHGLFDVRLASARALGYSLSISAIALVYVVLAYAFSSLFISGGVVASLSPINVVLALVLALIFQPIKQFFDRLTNNLFYRSDYSSEVFLREFGRILSFDTDLRLLLRQASSYITTTLGSEKAFFYIVGRGVLGQSGGKKVRIPDVDIESLEEYYLKNHESPEVIMLERLEDEKITRILQSYQAKIVLPLILQKQAIGFLFIGEHKSRGYAMRDIKVLESIANELTIAVQNSLSVEEIRDLNESLQGRVDEATAELRSNNRQLQRLDEAKNDFISMASHQLRTPLTSIKGYLDMILQGDLGKITNTQKTVLSEAFLSSERMVSLINDFLNVSRLQTGKFVIEKRDCNLSDIVKEQLQMLNVVAKQYDLKLQVDLCKNAPSVKLDEEKVRQVVLNFIDNAIYYSPAKSTIKVSLSCSKDKILFKVVDQGIGIPKTEQAGLFTKFYRASNARKRRPDGTGVGLFLAKKVITAHGGEIIFESIENKGSTFGFSLPAPPSKPPKKG